MSPIAVYPSLLRQSLSLVLELTVSSGRLAGHQGPASLHLSWWSHLAIVYAGWEQSPGPQAYTRMLLPANPSLCLHVSF